MASQRDLRIDFWRGLALLIVVVDHVEGWAERPLVATWTLMSLGFSDAAEVFIFLSGFVFATAYARTLERDGLSGCLKKSLKRALQIYAAYLLACFAVIGIGALLHDWNPPQFWTIPDVTNHEVRIGEQLGPSLWSALTLRFHPFGFDILAMYVLIMPLMAVLFFLKRRRAWLAWLISAGLYVAAQLYPQVSLHRFADGQVWYFNPLAWQFLFFIGICLGDSQSAGRIRVPRWLLLTLSIGLVGLGLFVVKISMYMIQDNPQLLDQLRPLYQFCGEWAAKTTLQPLRLLHFLALAYVVSQALPGRLAIWSTRAVRPVVVAGQHSLEVYAAGLVFSFLAVFAISRGYESPAAVFAFDVLVCVASLGFAYGVAWWKGAKNPPKPERMLALGSVVQAPNGQPTVKQTTNARRQRTQSTARQQKSAKK